jgi:hypothetical protein
MKKIILLIIFLLIGFLGSQINFIQAAPLIKGMKGKVIEELQQILKEDPTIYPEGLKTGFFGPATEEAVKRLQKKYGLAPTGVVDEKTLNVLFPPIEKIVITSPKENENWDRNQIHQIQWQIVFLESQPETIRPRDYFWKKATISLFKEEESRADISSPVKAKRFIKHLATVNLADSSYSWKISNDIPNGENYLIRISVFPELLMNPQEPLLGRKLWAESSRFKISGEILPPPPPNNTELRELLDLMRNIATKLNEAIRILERMIGPQIIQPQPQQ